MTPRTVVPTSRYPPWKLNALEEFARRVAKVGLTSEHRYARGGIAFRQAALIEVSSLVS